MMINHIYYIVEELYVEAIIICICTYIHVMLYFCSYVRTYNHVIILTSIYNYIALLLKVCM